MNLQSPSVLALLLAALSNSLSSAGQTPAASQAAPQQPPAQADAQRPPAILSPAGHASVDAIASRARSLVEKAGPRGAVTRIGTSREGRAIELVTLGEQDQSKRRPALLLIGGMDAEQLASCTCVLAALEAIVRDKPQLLDQMRVYAIPLANPDARASALASRSPRATNLRAIDDDRDGVADEDAPQDLNGDGLFTLMRRVAPPGRAPTHLVDAVDPRIVRAPKRDKGERATHELFVEGRDLDGDGAVAEDGSAGVDLDRNFSHRFPEFSAGAGPYQLSEPESLAIASFVRDHPDILTAVVFGRHDTLVNFPDTKDNDSTGRTPLVYLPDDHALYRDIVRIWKETTKIERSANADLAGSLVLWLANHRGITAVAANGWSKPELPKPAEGAPPPVRGDEEQAAWLARSDGLFGGAGFRAWTPFDHPTLGKVEIGGFVPFFRESPTAVEADELAAKCASFTAALAERRPSIEVSTPVVRKLADGLLRVDLRLTNAGNAPTATAMSTKADAAPPIIVRVPLKPEFVLAGRPVEKIERLEAGQSREFSWTLRAEPSTALAITVTGAWFDPISRPIVETPSAEATR